MKGDHRSGFTFGHAGRVPALVAAVRRGAAGADAIYLNLSQSVAGNLKDLAILAALRTRLDRVVVHVHGGGIARTVYGRSRALREVNRRFLSRVGAAIVLSDGLRAMLDGMVPDERVHAVPNFAPDDLYLDAARIAQKQGAADPLRVLFLSNLHPEKGLRDLLEAVRGLPGVRVDVAGGFVSPDQRAADESLLGAPGVTYHGVVEGAERRALLARAHVVALPTWYPYEGQPLCVLEGFASGCAVVTTRQGGLGDVVQDGVHGAIVPARDPAAIHEALRRLRDDLALRTRQALANREHAERFRIRAHLDRMRDVLRRVVDPTRPRPRRPQSPSS